MTTRKSFERVFDRLKESAPTWDVVIDMPLAQLKALIKDAGLSRLKAPRIQSILRRVSQDFGTVTLEPLRSMNDAAAEPYLAALPGVGVKTAKCVLMYSFARDVLPADTHVARVARRLGLVAADASHEATHREIEEAVQAGDRYDFHVNALSHGRAVCLALRPRCEECAIKNLCSHHSDLAPRRERPSSREPTSRGRSGRP